MRLDLNCVRDVLLVLEDKLEYGKDKFINAVPFDEFVTLSPLDTYDMDLVLYACDKLNEGGYIGMHDFEADDTRYDIILCSLTFKGHQFLDNIRKPDVWEKVKSIGGKVGAVSLSMVSRIAGEVLGQLISNQFN